MEAEKQVIGTFLNNKYLEYINALEPSEFIIYPKTMEAIKECYKTDGYVNVLKVKEKSEFNLSELSEVMEANFPAVFKDYYRALKEKTIKEKLRNTVNHSISSMDGDFKKDISKIVAEIENISSQVIVEESDMCIDYFDELDRRAKNDNRMKYGIPKLDNTTGGIKKQEFTILAARPAVGKSAFSLQIAENAAKHGRVLFVSLEMSKNQIVERLACKHTDIPHENLKNGKLVVNEDRDEWKILSSSFDKIPHNLKVLDKTVTLESVRAAIEKFSPDLVIIDQITIMKCAGKYNSRREEIVNITRALKLMSGEYDMAVIGLAQINRTAQERIPTLADLKESGSFEEDADNVIILHRLTESEWGHIERFREASAKRCEDEGIQPYLINLAKHRNGETVVIPSYYCGSKFTLREVDGFEFR